MLLHTKASALRFFRILTYPPVSNYLVNELKPIAETQISA